MLKHHVLALSALLLATSSAQSPSDESPTTDSSSSGDPRDPVVSLFLPMADPQPLVASVISAKPSATTYLISCPEISIGGDTADCGFDPPQTVTEGPSTAAATFKVEGYFAAYGCELSGTTEAVCVTSASGANLGTEAGKGTTTLMQSEIQYLPVTITSGGEKVSGTTGNGDTTATAASESGSAAVSASGTITGPASASTGVAQETASSTGAAGSVSVRVGAVGAGMIGAVVALI